MAELNRCYRYFGITVLALYVQGVCIGSEEAVREGRSEPGYKINIYYEPKLPARSASRPIMDLRRIRALKGNKCAVGGEDRTPLEETALLRGTLSLPITDTQARLHAAAQLSQYPVAATGLLADELASGDVIRAYAAALTIAFVAAKTDPSLRMDRTEQALGRLEQAAKRAGLPCADCAYLRALQAWSAGDEAAAQRLVESARALYPHYFNALVLGVILHVEQLDGPAATRSDTCAKVLTELMGVLMTLSELNPCPLQAGHLDLLVSRHFEHPDRHSAVLATRLVLAEIARNRPTRRRGSVRRPDIGQRPAPGLQTAVGRRRPTFVTVGLKAVVKGSSGNIATSGGLGTATRCTPSPSGRGLGRGDQTRNGEWLMNLSSTAFHLIVHFQARRVGCAHPTGYMQNFEKRSTSLTA